MEPAPVTQAQPKPFQPKQFQRVYRACDHCHQRRIKCEMDPANPQPPCARCVRYRRECTFDIVSTREDVQAPASHEQEVSDVDFIYQIPEDILSVELSTLQNTNLVSEEADLTAKLADVTDTITPKAYRLHKSQSAYLRHIASTDPVDLDAAIKVWSAYPLVKDGSMSPQDAIEYMVFFYEKLANLTPITLPDCMAVSRHQQLIDEEPMLTLVILLIASRHYKPPCVGSCQQGFLQFSLWEIFKRMTNRVLLPGNALEQHLTPAPFADLETVGTIEALLLMTEWHSRSTRFPSATSQATWMYNGEPASLVTEFLYVPSDPPGLRPGRATEPTAKADRMSWNLTMMALSIAVQIGICSQPGSNRASAENDPHRVRKETCKFLIWICVTRVTSRLSLSPLAVVATDVLELSPIVRNGRRGEMLKLWFDLTHMIADCVKNCFATLDQTQQLVKSGKYHEKLDTFQPAYKDFQNQLDFTSEKWLVHPVMRAVLQMELDYASAHLNMLSLAAWYDRCQSAQPHGPGSHYSQADLDKHRGEDDRHVNQIVASCQSMLETLVETIYPAGWATFLPVRTVWTIYQGAIMLMKTFAFGARAPDMKVSIKLLYKTCDIFRETAADDIHIMHIYADTVHFYVRAIERFVNHNQRKRRASTSLSSTAQRFRRHSTSRLVNIAPGPAPAPATAPASTPSTSEDPYAPQAAPLQAPPINEDPYAPQQAPSQAPEIQPAQVTSQTEPAQVSPQTEMEWASAQLDPFLEYASNHELQYGTSGPTFAAQDEDLLDSWMRQALQDAPEDLDPDFNMGGGSGFQ